MHPLPVLVLELSNNQCSLVLYSCLPPIERWGEGREARKEDCINESMTMIHLVVSITYSSQFPVFWYGSNISSVWKMILFFTLYLYVVGPWRLRMKNAFICLETYFFPTIWSQTSFLVTQPLKLSNQFKCNWNIMLNIYQAETNNTFTKSKILKGLISMGPT